MIPNHEPVIADVASRHDLHKLKNLDWVHKSNPYATKFFKLLGRSTIPGIGLPARQAGVKSTAWKVETCRDARTARLNLIGAAIRTGTLDD